MNKKILVLLSVILLCIGLMGCGQSESTSIEKSTESVGSIDETAVETETKESAPTYVLLEERVTKSDSDFIEITKYSYTSNGKILEENKYSDENDPNHITKRTVYDYGFGEDKEYSLKRVYKDDAVTLEAAYKEDGKRVYERQYTNDGTLLTREELYDDEGRLISDVEFSGGKEVKRKEYAYNSQGLQSDYYQIDDEDRHEVYEYASNGTLINQKLYYAGELSLEYEWTEDGVQTARKKYREGVTEFVLLNYDENGKIISEVDGSLKNEDFAKLDRNIVYGAGIIYTYDENGYLILEERYDGYHVVATKVTYQNDEQGRKIDEYAISRGTFDWHRSYEYGDGEKPIIEHRYYDSGIEYGYFKFAYNSEGEKTTKLFISPDGDIEEGTECIYDENGNIIIDRSYSDDNSNGFFSEKIYERNEAGDNIHITHTYDGELYEEIFFTYDEFGNLIKKETQNVKEGTTIKEYIYGYIE